MARWIRFEHNNRILFGTVHDDLITVHEGDMLNEPSETEEQIPLGSVEVRIPVEPTKMIGLWNNLRAAADKQGWPEPDEPLYFFKAPSCFLPSGGVIVKPEAYEGRVVYEGELGIVIGRRCSNLSDDNVDDHIFGYTCVNDVTALQLIHREESFPQWCRSKSFDTFGAFGPVVVTDVDPNELRVTTTLNGRVRQDYPVSDMFFSPRELVRRISQGMTLFPGDVIACGTSTGALPMKPGSTVEVTIDGIGTLSNTFA